MTRGANPTPLAGRRVTVMGLGLFGGGAAATRFLLREGAEVTLTDLRDARTLGPALDELEGLPVRLRLGEHREQDFTGADLVIANPAVPPSSPYLAAARAAGVPVGSEVALFLDRVDARVIGVTGTQGKSSTCHLLAGILAGAGERAWLGGNIGHSLLDDLDALRPEHFVVLELSSYQLERLPEELSGARPLEAGVIVNVLADHLERHGSVEAYARAKGRLRELVRPGGLFLAGPGTAELPAVPDVPVVALPGFGPSELSTADGAFRNGPELLAEHGDLLLPGAFQRSNALVALGLAHHLGVPRARLGAALRGVRGLPHRLEPLAPVAGHPVWDNGVSTTPDSTVSALLALDPGLTLVAGGAPKDLPLDELLRVASQRARRVVLFGAAAPRWSPRFRATGLEVHAVPDVPAAVALALERAAPGEALLFSPAAASFDAYPNFRARAEEFRRALARPLEP